MFANTRKLLKMGNLRPSIPLVTKHDKAPKEVSMKILPAEDVHRDEDFFEYNKRLKRCMSPHLSIYRPQITTVLSITNRIAGAVMSTYVSGLGLSTLLFQANMTEKLSAFEELGMPSVVLILLKLLITIPFSFHFYNGVRHLACDLGHGFEIPDFYRSGYATIIGTAITSIVLALI